MQMSRDRNRLIQNTLTIALVGNIFSVVVKLLFGFLANSIAMIADAIHSIFDSISSVIGIYGVRASVKPPDLEHPYGHRKFEYIASIGIATMVFIAGFNIIHEAIERVISATTLKVTFFSYLAIVFSMIISLTVSLYERRVGVQTSSVILVADASHSFTDVLASLVVIIGLIGTEMGYAYADPVAAVIVCSIIAFIGISMFKKASSVLVDRGISQDTIYEIEAVAKSIKKDIGFHSIRGRIVGDKIYVDMHVTINGNKSVKYAHSIADLLEKELKKRIEGIEEVIIYIEPKE